jgi:cytochrome c553
MSVRVVPRPVAALLFAASLASAQPSPGAAASPGEQLYSAHCDTCHTAQLHWRDNRIAKDWPGLVAQVRRWQSNIGLGWSDEEIREVARHLNSRYYHFAEPQKQASVTGRR